MYVCVCMCIHAFVCVWVCGCAYVHVWICVCGHPFSIRVYTMHTQPVVGGHPPCTFEGWSAAIEGWVRRRVCVGEGEEEKGHSRIKEGKGTNRLRSRALVHPGVRAKGRVPPPPQPSGLTPVGATRQRDQRRNTKCPRREPCHAVAPHPCGWRPPPAVGSAHRQDHRAILGLAAQPPESADRWTWPLPLVMTSCGGGLRDPRCWCPSSV